MVTKCYHTCFALKNADGYFLVDAGGGNGILAQIEKAGIPWQDLRSMFVTHAHTDHVLGVIWVIRTIAALIESRKYADTLTIYCHAELAHAIAVICKLTLPGNLLHALDRTIILRTIENGETCTIAGLSITFFDIGSTKTKQFGFQALLPDNQRLVCLGDEPCKESSKKYARNCTWLLCEAFCLYEDRDIFRPYEKHHSTALDAGRMAEELHVKNLILYHTEDSNLKERKALYTREAATVFSGTVLVPDDLEAISLASAPGTPLSGIP